MSSPREKDTTDQDDDEVPGRLRPPRPFDKTKQTAWRIEFSIKNGSRYEAVRIPSAAASRIFSSDRRSCRFLHRPCPRASLLIRIVRGNNSSAENPAGYGSASTGPKLKNRYNQSERGRRRAERGLAALEICRKKRKIPAPLLAGQGFFAGYQSAEEPSRSLATGWGLATKARLAGSRCTMNRQRPLPEKRHRRAGQTGGQAVRSISR